MLAKYTHASRLINATLRGTAIRLWGELKDIAWPMKDFPAAGDPLNCFAIAVGGRQLALFSEVWLLVNF
jgi:hypothetical protein